MTMKRMISYNTYGSVQRAVEVYNKS